MVERVDLAWKLLEITGLALPALAILVQALLQMSDDRQGKILHRYKMSLMALFLLVPLSATGAITIVTISKSYNLGWLSLAMTTMAISFLSVPVFVILRWRESRQEFTEVYLEEQQTEIEETPNDDLPMDKEKMQNTIKSYQNGILWSLKNMDKPAVAARIKRILAVLLILSVVVFAVS